MYYNLSLPDPFYENAIPRDSEVGARTRPRGHARGAGGLTLPAQDDILHGAASWTGLGLLAHRLVRTHDVQVLSYLWSGVLRLDPQVEACLHDHSSGRCVVSAVRDWGEKGHHASSEGTKNAGIVFGHRTRG